MDLKFLKETHTYLVRPSYSSDRLTSITVLVISDKAYKLRWNDHCNDHIEWILKSSLDSDYYFVEDVSDIVGNKLKEKDFKNNDEVKFYFNNTEVKLQPFFYLEETCETCGGEKKIPDDHTTSCKRECPACNGTGKQSKKIQIFTE
jgi:two-component SAPR family response regulator